MKYEIVAIGNAIMDIIAEVDEFFIVNNGLVKSTMTLIDNHKAAVLLGNITSSKKVSGGSVANTAVGMALLGAKAGFIGKVKNDIMGRDYIADLKHAGVFYNTEAEIHGEETAFSVVFVTPDAERTMATYLGATRNINREDVDVDMVSNAKILFVEGYLWDEENAKDAILYAIEVATKSSIKIAFTLSDLFCVSRHKEEFLNLVKNHVSILFANEQEICALFDVSDLNEAIEIAGNICDIAVVTRASNGSIIISKQNKIEIAALKNLNVIDVTGAGDLYAAGFLYGIANGYDIKSCGRLATLSASHIIERIGARPDSSTFKKILNMV